MAQSSHMRARWLCERLLFVTFRFSTLGRALSGTFSCLQNRAACFLISRCSARTNVPHVTSCVVVWCVLQHSLAWACCAHHAVLQTCTCILYIEAKQYTATQSWLACTYITIGGTYSATCCAVLHCAWEVRGTTDQTQADNPSRDVCYRNKHRQPTSKTKISTRNVTDRDCRKLLPWGTTK